jgi:hypothetical protein
MTSYLDTGQSATMASIVNPAIDAQGAIIESPPPRAAEVIAGHH